MFSGKAYHNIAAKGRLFIPATFREELGNSFIVTNGYGRYLHIYTLSEWEKYLAKIDALGLDKKIRDYKRKIMLGSCPTEMDSQGRIVISKEHREFASLEKEVVFIGMTNYIEIWDSRSLAVKLAEDEEEDAAGYEEFISMIK